MWPRWLVGLVVGALALFVANWALTNLVDWVTSVSAAIDLTSKVIGFLGVAIGLGSIGVSASTKGLTGLDAPDISGPGVITIAGAILLAAS